MGAVWALQPKLNPLLLIGVAGHTKKHREIASQCFMRRAIYVEGFCDLPRCENRLILMQMKGKITIIR